MTECPNCRRTFAVATDVCGGCGHRLDTATDDAPTGVMTATAERAPAAVGSWASTPLSPTTTWHRVPETGLQSYVEPELESDAGQFVPGGAQVGLVTTQNEWAQIVFGGTTTWVDGRALNPPVFGAAPTATSAANATRSSTTRSRRSSTSPHSIWSILSALAGFGVLVGAIVEWTKGSINSFDLPFRFLFETRALFEDREPRIGYFVATLGVVAILASFSADYTWVRRLAGFFTLAIALLFCYQVQHFIDQVQSSPLGVIAHSNRDFFDLIGAGPFITGFCGLALAVLPRPDHW